MIKYKLLTYHTAPRPVLGAITNKVVLIEGPQAGAVLYRLHPRP